MTDRYDLDRLLTVAAAAAGVPLHVEGCTWCLGAGCYGTSALAADIGVTPRTVSRWRSLGGIDFAWADRAAVRLGLTPELVWPDFHLPDEAYDKLEAEDAEAAAREQERIDRRRAQQRAYAARRRQDPEFQAKQAERQRVYEASLGPAARRQLKKLATARQVRYRASEKGREANRLASARAYERDPESKKAAARARYWADPEAARERSRQVRAARRAARAAENEEGAA